ncbi:MAG: 2,3-bisphosphoglycerate-independent phosphoglycerate mutase [Rhodobacterales bacterium]|jgi:2,3-bisphosphoglycerate-independent phosphoglycerate mutase|nr:2,3-bisphosphoglycerate-independent phosphoglycerate mutase [Pseudomonadota bacterium]NQW14435.1 2,3-bisphosphoglycerate-independent phosphoglycerate mutase [Rhodobacter sp.]
MTTPKPVILCILDGWGLRTERANNAPVLANTPTFDRLMATCPNATLKTCGRDVGLPDGQMGNSEVGHMNIGAGRVVSMDLGKIDLAIEDGSFASNPALVAFIAKLKSTGGTAHLIGLASYGGVHAHINHLIAAANVIAAAGVPVNIHALTDGRDVPPGSAANDLATLAAASPSNASIATVIGRFYALDRDNRWGRVKLAYDAIVHAKGHAAANPAQAITDATARGESDEFISPTVIGTYQGTKDGDGILCLNFRADRARELMAALGDKTFDAFEISKRAELAAMAGMASYSDQHNAYMDVLFPKANIINTLGHWVAIHGKSQFRLAETEKYPHVTFFLNGGQETPEKGEDRMMPKSPKVATYDLQPEMSSVEVTDRLVAAIEHGYDLIVVNYANPDMVGHTGDQSAAIAACEAVDHGLNSTIKALAQAGGAMIITADHGNCETMVDPETGNPHTAHTTNPVPVILVGGPQNATLRKGGRLADLAPTLLQLMGLPQPPEMTGQSLLLP